MQLGVSMPAACCPESFMDPTDCQCTSVCWCQLFVSQSCVCFCQLLVPQIGFINPTEYQCKSVGRCLLPVSQKRFIDPIGYRCKSVCLWELVVSQSRCIDPIGHQFKSGCLVYDNWLPMQIGLRMPAVRVPESFHRPNWLSMQICVFMPAVVPQSRFVDPIGYQCKLVCIFRDQLESHPSSYSASSNIIWICH